MQQQVFQQPIYVRCQYISKWVDEWNNKDLEYIFPDVVENIFGINNKVRACFYEVNFKNCRLFDFLSKVRTV